jgi:putative ABC transport system permease protein
MANPLPLVLMPINTLSYLRFAAGSLKRSPTFTLFSVLTLTIGIGATTAVFSVFSSAMLRSLPYPDAGRLVVVAESRGQTDEISVSYPDLADWQARTRSFEQLAGFVGQSFNLVGEEQPERLRGQLVTANLFSTLGVKPVMGRDFLAEDDRPGAPRVVAISHALWANRFASDAGIIGRTISLNEEPTTIVAVMPAGFRFPDGMVYGPSDLWHPTGGLPGDDLTNRDSHPGLAVVGRLKPGLDLEAGTRDLASIAARLREEHPVTNRDVGIITRSALDSVVGDVRSPLTILLAAVTLLLLIACGNVAALILTRASTRTRELAIRSALGAGRRHVLGQLLSEGFLLALLGAVGGTFVALLLTRLGGSLLAGLPRMEAIGLDWRVLLVTTAAVVVTGALFGLTPLLQLGRGFGDSMRVRAASAGLPGTRSRRILVAAEIALALVLMIGATVLFQSFRNLANERGGIDPSGVTIANLRLPDTTYDGQRSIAFWDQLMARIQGAPGIISAGAVSVLPFSGAGAQSGISPHELPPSKENEIRTDVQAATPGYFTTMGVSLLKGRLFDSTDDALHPAVAVVDERFAERFWPGQDPIGRQVAGWGFRELTVVGVVRHVKRYGVAAESREELYVPLAQRPFTRMTIVVKTAGDQATALTVVRREVQALDPSLPIYDYRPMAEVVSGTIAGPRVVAVLSAAFAIIAAVLAVVGIYGVMAFVVATRTREIGIRSALGADRAMILNMISRQAMTLAVGGTTAGVLVSLAIARLLQGFVYQVEVTSVATYVAVSAGMLLMALLASAGPAARAARVSPLVALNEE